MSRKGPFGVAMGMSVDEIGVAFEEVAPFKYLLETVPKPHSAFTRYVVQAPPICGLSWLKAIGHTITTNPYGITLRTSFEEMEAKLIAAYGSGERIDILMHDSIWNEPRDWMTGLVKGERILMTNWSVESRALPDSLSAIGLLAIGLDSESGYIAIEYSFENSASADAEIAAAEDDAL